jgi:hypothetical protein
MTPDAPVSAGGGCGSAGAVAVFGLTLRPAGLPLAITETQRVFPINEIEAPGLHRGDVAGLDVSPQYRPRHADDSRRLGDRKQLPLLLCHTANDTKSATSVVGYHSFRILSYATIGYGGMQMSKGPRGWNLKGSHPWAKEVNKRGEEHYAWKGDEVDPDAARCRARRAYRELGDCERCGEPAVDRHHKDGNTRHNARSNLAFLCRRCHMAIDGRLERLAVMGMEYQKPQPPKSCRICSKPYKPLRKGRCASCNEYRRRNGRDRNEVSGVAS